MGTALSSRLRKDLDLYSLTTGAEVTTRTAYSAPGEEYRSAFADRSEPFLYYYKTEGDGKKERFFTRGEFWDLAMRSTECLATRELSKGDRVVHCFSENRPDDLAFRLAGAFTGCVPVTINWQSDDNRTIIYKATITDARLLIYDRGFEHRIGEIKAALPDREFLAVEDMPAIGKHAESSNAPIECRPGYGDEKIIIFTAGTTGAPKGVILSHRSFLANRLTFDEYFGLSESSPLDLLLVNPLHHTNSSALSDWALRRRSAVIHLVQRYATSYWRILTRAVQRKRGLLVAPLVSRHIDFLDNLMTTSQLPVSEKELRAALGETDILIGSAPVGPTTVRRILDISGRTPLVRFGSTETCLQVMAIPREMKQDDVMAAFQAGWNHQLDGRNMTGYYIGRSHFPFTRVKIVKEIVPGEKGYLRPCEYGEPGYLITQGANIMSGYAGPETTAADVFREGWYTGFRDIAFCLKGSDGEPDYYWMARDSSLLIRGGANYACEQVAAALSRLIEEDFQVKPEQFRLAVIGLRLDSEHDDSCCVTIELSRNAASLEPVLKNNFRTTAQKLPKGYRPDYVRFADIPTSFKGAVLVPRLKEEFEKDLNERTRQQEKQER